MSESSLISNSSFAMPPVSWGESWPTLQVYAQVLGKVRRALAPRQKHWSHVSLRVSTTGLTTSPMPHPPFLVELALDLVAHEWVYQSSKGTAERRPLGGQSPAAFLAEVTAVLGRDGLHPEIDSAPFSDERVGVYDQAAVGEFATALRQIYMLMSQFRGELRGETSPIQMWPHHFDLAMLAFSGRLVEGQDPANEEYADEQMNFGFAPADASIPEPYFYITAYPFQPQLMETPLPTAAYWHTAGFTGAILPYAALTTAEAPDQLLLGFWRTVYGAWEKIVKSESKR